ncbi:MAG: DUF58 domain-containing protein, partial [Deinococcus sp.]|nr:DUF58 domain-containing protein [Deinococcus sp.]
VLDWWLAPKPGQLVVERVVSPRLYLAAENPVTITIRNQTSRLLPLELRDEPPERFRASQIFFGLHAPPGRSQVDYQVVPPARGAYRFGLISLRYPGPVGLVRRQASYGSGQQEVHVYPDLRKMIHDRLPGKVDEGRRRSRRGAGTEFSHLREYRAGDDYRHINWKATARRRLPVSNEYESEKSQNVVLALDLGRAMSAVVGPLSKLDHAVGAALAVASTAVKLGDRVGLLTFADRVEAFLPPRRTDLPHLVEALYQVQAGLTEPDYGAALAFYRSRQRRRSLFILFTDLYDPAVSQMLAGAVSRLAAHHLPVCVAVADPEVHRLAALAPVDSQATYQRAVASRVLDERSTVLGALRRRGVLVIDVPADKLSGTLVARYLDIKRRARL